MTHAEKSGMAELAVPGPLNEAYLYHDLRLDPVRAYARQADGFGEWRRLYFDLIELGAELEEQFRIKAGTDLSGEDKIVAVIIANQQSAQADAFSLRIGEATNYKLLGQFAFHL